MNEMKKRLVDQLVNDQRWILWEGRPLDREIVLAACDGIDTKPVDELWLGAERALYIYTTVLAERQPRVKRRLTVEVIQGVKHVITFRLHCEEDIVESSAIGWASPKTRAWGYQARLTTEQIRGMAKDVPRDP